MACFKKVRSFVSKCVEKDTDEIYFIKKRLTEVNYDIQVLQTSIAEEIPFPPGIDAQQLLVEHVYVRRLLHKGLREEKKRIMLIRLAFARGLKQITNIEALEHVVFRTKACRERSSFVNKVLDEIRTMYYRVVEQDNKVALQERIQQANLKRQIQFGGYKCLPMDPDVPQVECDSEPEVDQEGVERVPIHNRPRRRFYDYSNLISTQQRLTREVKIPIVRNRALILRLRKVIVALRLRNRSFIKSYYERLQRYRDLNRKIVEDIPMQPIIENQMDKEGDPHGSCNDLDVNQKSNVILTTHTTEESIAKPVNIPSDNWQRMCTSEPKQDYSILMTRWQKFKTVKWSRDQANNTVLKSASSILPIDFIKQNQDSPSCILFKQYAYFRSDMEIKIVINSNKFHCGALQASFYYGGTLDKYYKDRENIACASQMTHCIVDAASATDGLLVIPYRFYKPLMGTTLRADDTDILDMGVFRLIVLNQLKTPVDDNVELDVTIYFRFVDPSFHGMKPRRLGKVSNQMFGASSMLQMVKETANVINQVFPDPQRDNPSDVIPPKPMVPWSAHSWCVGDVCPEPINPLRLQAVGNTPHPPGTLPVEPEMQISYVTSVFGLVDQIKWSSNQVQGTLLKSFPFSPVLPFDSYLQVKCKNGSDNPVSCSVLPPVSVMAELFAYWRGSIEYKFDFIATQFHTGRLIIAYIPRIVDLASITLEDLTHCDNIIVDLREERQVNYICNFLSDKPWWPKRGMNDTSSEMYPPGTIQIRVLNQLTATSAVSKDIEFNMYMRAGRDFELHVPVAPNIGLSFNTKIIEPKVNLYTYLESYGPPQTDLYIGGWHSVNPSGKIAAVFRYGSVSDHVTQFQELLGNKVVIGKVFELVTDTFIHVDTLPFPYLVPFKIKNDSHMYGAAFSTLVSAQLMASYLLTNKELDISQPKVLALFETISQDGDWIDRSHRVFWKEASLNDFVIINQAGDERKSACGDQVQLNGSLSSTWNGMLTFGEQISDLKQLLRRYQPYCQYVGKKSVDYSPAEADFGIPLMPQGLDLVIVDKNKKEVEYSNKVRDGPIPIIASGYRFYRGSMRLRLIVVGAQDGAFWLQHRPEYRLANTKVFVPSQDGSERLYQHGYASLIQMSKTNNVIECEIPFYLPGQFGLLQRPKLEKIGDAVHFSLGTLYCGFDTVKGSTTKEVPFVVQGYYSMGDDMSFSIFQGFPPMIDLSINKRPKAQGPISWLSSKISASVVGQLAQDVNTAAREAVATTSTESSNLFASLSTLIDSHMGDLSTSQKTLIATSLSQVVHCIINPNIKTLAWAIVSLFIQLGILSYNYVTSLVKSISDVLTRLVNRAQKPDSAPVVQAEGPDDDDAASYISVVLTSMLAIAGNANKKLPRSLPDFASCLYSGMNKFTLNANGLFRFLQNNLTMFKKMWLWLVSFFYSDAALFAEIKGADQYLIDFVTKVQWCLDARNELAIKNEPKHSTRVYQLANIASLYMAKKSAASLSKSTPCFDHYCRQIISLRNDLAREMKSPPIRFEPHVMCFVGDSNVGKSHLAQELTRKLLHKINYKTYDETVYTRTPGNAYWNGLNNQPICLFDDFLNIEHVQQAHLQIGELFCLKSKAVFNPPMAAIEEKKLRYNPLIVALCCNKAFPKIDGLALEEAWMRRRDIMIKVVKVDKYKGVHPRDLPRDIKENYGHLKFGIYENPSGKDTTGQDSRVDPDCTMTYDELYEELGKRFTHYFEEECNQFDRSMQKLKEFYPSSTLSVEDSDVALTKFIENHNSVHAPSGPIVTLYKQAFDQLTEGQDMNKFVQESLVKSKESKLKMEEVQTELADNKIVSNCGASYFCVESTNGSFCGDTFKRFGSRDPVYVKRMLIREEFDPDNLQLSFQKQQNGAIMNAFKKSQQYIGKEVIDLQEELKCANFKIEQFMLRSRNKIVFPQNLNICYCLKLMDGVAGVPYGVSSIEWLSEERCYEFEWYVDRFTVKKKRISVGGCGQVSCPLVSASGLKSIYPKLLLDIISMPREKWPIGLQEDESLRNFGAIYSAEEVIEEITNPSLYSRVMAKFPSWWDIFVKLMKASLLCSALLSAYAGITGVANLILPQKPIEQALNYSSRIAASTLGKVIDPKPICQASETQESVILAKIDRNTFFINIEFGENFIRNRAFRCVGLLRHYFIMLDHYIYFINSIKTPYRAYFVQGTSRIEIPSSIFSLSNVKAVQGSAVMICTMNSQIPQFVNLIKFIARGSQIRNHPPSAKLIEKQFNPQNGTFSMVISEFAQARLSKSIRVDNDDGSTTLVDNIFAYARSGRGICGSLLVTTMNTNSPICGIHVAGLNDGKEGYAEVLTYETFQPLFEEEGIVATENGGIDLTFRKPIMKLEGNVIDEGTLPSGKGESMYPPTSSRLIPTECAGIFNPVTFAKPVLSSKDHRILEDSFSPILEGCKHHANPCLPFPEALEFRACEDVENMVLSHVVPQRREVGKLSYEQAICGILGNTMYEPMVMATSEGYPWIKRRPAGASSKEWMFDRELTTDGWILKSMDKELQDEMDRKDEERRRGIYQFTLFTDCLKDAKLPKEKVLIPGKTRIFSISPVDFTIQQRQYSYDFVVAYQQARFKTEHAVGIDIYGMETDKMVRWMLERGNNMVCGDYSKFGDQLYVNLVRFVYVLISKWYQRHGCVNEDHGRVLRCMGEEVAHARHIMINHVYTCFGGMPSGNPLTVIINSIVNSIYIRIVWQDIMLNVSLRLIDMDSFHRNVRMLTFGDDIWMVVSDDVINYFNAITISDCFAKYNIKFTNSTKGDTMISHSKLSDPDTTFLKCTFQKHEFRNIYIAKLELRVVEETCNWTWNTQPDVREASLQACKEMMELSYGHGKQYYERRRRIIMEYWQNKQVEITIPDWDALDMRIYEQ